ncbi:MAG TPA: SDR family oxidoreductase [Puia sp.]|jgi:NAD(P)-dependent dehydrogenase (short-subunit alcohol dehydrogenase family)
MKKKVAIITGASRGIGRATTLKFAEGDFNVTLVGRDLKNLREVSDLISREYKADTLVCRGDIGEEEFIREITGKTFEKWGRLDVLVNNAAWRSVETMRTISRETWEKTLGVCLTAPAFLAKNSADIMERLKIRGTIINVSSIMSGRAGGNSPAYIACKGAMDSLTYELAIAYGRSGIRVLAVNPGHIETDMSRDYVDGKGEDLSDRMINYVVGATPLGRGGSPEEVAEAIYWLSTEKASFITGTTLTIDGGFTHNLNDYSIKKQQFPKEY